MNEKLQQFQDLKDAREKKQYFETEKVNHEGMQPEMHLEDWKMKMKSLEISILQARADIYRLEETLELDPNDPDVKKIEQDALAEIAALEQETEGVIAGDFDGAHAEIDNVLTHINDLTNRLGDAGYTLDDLRTLKDSENEDEKRFHDEIVAGINSSELEERIRKIEKENPVLLIESLAAVKEPAIRAAFLGSLSENQSVPHGKLVEGLRTHVSRNHDEVFREAASAVEQRLQKEKQRALAGLSGEEILDAWEQDPDNYHSDLREQYKQKIEVLFQKMAEATDAEGVRSLWDRLSRISKSVKIHPSEFLPVWVRSINDEDAVKALTGELTDDSFHYYFSNKYVPHGLVPKSLMMSHVGNVFEASKLNPKELDEYFSLTGDTFQNLPPERKLKILESFGPNKEGMVFDIEDYRKIIASTSVDPLLVPVELRGEIKAILSADEKRIMIRNGRAQIEGMVFDLSDYKEALGAGDINPENVPMEFRDQIKKLYSPSQKLNLIEEGKAGVEGMVFTIDDYKEALQPGVYLSPSRIPVEFRKELKNHFSTEQKVNTLRAVGSNFEGIEFTIDDYKEILSSTYINPSAIPEELQLELRPWFGKGGRKAIEENSFEGVSNTFVREAMFDTTQTDLLETNSQDPESIKKLRK